MMHKAASQAQGFTLIELSIVLVIIGLIVGGVLVGQDLIKAAAVRAQISQIEKFNTAANTFYGKYGGLPGDLQVPLANQFGFNTTGCTGAQGNRDGNGLLEGGGGTGLTLDGGAVSDGDFESGNIQFLGETGLFWEDLTDAGLIEGKYPAGGVLVPGCVAAGYSITSTAAATASYFPAAKIDGGNYLYVYPYNSLNWYGLAVLNVGVGATDGGPGMSVAQAYAIDQKLDDGRPATGNVQAMTVTGVPGVTWPSLVSAPNAPAASATTCFDTTSGNYSVTVSNGSNVNCALSFQMQAGD